MGTPKRQAQQGEKWLFFTGSGCFVIGLKICFRSFLSRVQNVRKRLILTNFCCLYQQ
jgi:hypothetical protein